MSEERGRSVTDWLGISNAPNWAVARPMGRIVGAVLVVAVPALFFGALLAAGFVLYHTISLVINGSKEGISLGVGALVAALLGAPFVIWGTVLKHQTVMFQKEGHMTDRINKAVEQLGAEKTVDRIGRSVTITQSETPAKNVELDYYTKTLIEWQGVAFDVDEGWWIEEFGDWKVFSESVPNIEVRIGAILSLERIAQDSLRHDYGRDHVRVMEIFCAYIRENTKGVAIREFSFPSQSNDSGREYSPVVKFNLSKDVRNESEVPRLDVQTALSAVGRCSAKQTETVSSGFRIDLINARLQGADFSKNNTFSDAILYKRARLSGAHMEQAILSKVNLSFALLNNVHLCYAFLVETDLKYAKLQMADLRGAAMPCADFSFANLDGVMFSESSIVLGAKFEKAALRNTDISMLNISYDQFCVAFGDATVKLPHGIDVGSPQWPQHWPVWELPEVGELGFESQRKKWLSEGASYRPPKRRGG